LRSKSRFRPLKIGDILVIILFLSFVFFLPKKHGEKVIISVDKTNDFVYPLNQNKEIIVNGKLGEAKIEIRDGKVRILNSPCPLKICEKKGWISKKGDFIICVPNRVIIKIEGKKYDAVTE
jgi:hypothetical protein